MASKVIGIDPDCKKSGVAIYHDGILVELLNLDLDGYIMFLMDLADEHLNGFISQIAIEDSSLNKFVYSRNTFKGDTPQLKAKMSMDIGRIQQQSIVMGQLAEFYGLNITRYKPCKGNWQSSRRKDSENGEIFKAATEWSGRSNAETRSAAYFGYKHLKATV